MNELPQSLELLREYPQFILVNDNKEPITPTGYPVTAHDAANWMDADTAISTAQRLGVNVGFVFTDRDPFWFLDIDHCVSEGQWSETAQYFLNLLNGAAVEVSRSGEGLHMFGTGTCPDHRKKNKDYGIELYTEGRFVLLTGNQASGNIRYDAGAILPGIVSYFFDPTVTNEMPWSDQPDPMWNGPTDDEVLVNRMLAQVSARQFGGGASIADLWFNNERVLSGAYPSETDTYNRSAADAALANHLAFWTGKNHTRMWNLMYQSQLARPKWDPENHRTYLQGTVTNAVNACRNVYSNQRQPQTGTEETQSGSEVTTGGHFQSCHQQVEFFANCYYLKRRHRVFIPTGEIVKPEVFKAVYGGYEFAMDHENRRSVRNAFEALTESQAIRHPKLTDVVFDPKLEPYQIVNDSGEQFVNSYIPVDIPQKKGDPSLFTTHMQKLFPNQQDYDIILSYMAAMVQYKGSKFQWCPVIQGAEGNGKSLIARCLQHALGARYCHFPNATDLAGNGLKFNGWVEGNLGIFIEEMYVGGKRFDLLDGMKPLITNDDIEIQRKGADQYTGRICCNFVINTNHKDAIKDSADQRRYWINYTAQQSYDDILRDGMDGKYFKALYEWLKDGGYAIVTDYLMTYVIPDELNPATSCTRAPETSTKSQSIYETLGPAQEELLEAVDEGVQGFRGGYISSKMVTKLFRDHGHRFGPRMMSKLLEELSYVRHPSLRDGRTPSTVLAEGGKPTLYVKKSDADRMPDHRQVDPATVQQDYETRQGYQQVS